MLDDHKQAGQRLGSFVSDIRRDVWTSLKGPQNCSLNLVVHCSTIMLRQQADRLLPQRRRPCYSCLPLMSQRTRSGDIGMSKHLLPKASEMALRMAAPGGTMLGSPTIRAP